MDEPWVKHNRVNVVLQDLTPSFFIRATLAACAAEVRPGSGDGMVQGTRADPVHELRGGDGDCENADSVGVLWGHAAAHCHPGNPLTM